MIIIGTTTKGHHRRIRRIVPTLVILSAACTTDVHASDGLAGLRDSTSLVMFPYARSVTLATAREGSGVRQPAAMGLDIADSGPAKPPPPGGVLAQESADSLFVSPPEEEAPPEKPTGTVEPEAETLDGLFLPDERREEAKERKPIPFWSGRFEGFIQNEGAYTVPEPDHFSKWKNILRISTSGRLTDRISWQAGGHIIYDPIFELESEFYPDDVEDDQEFDAYAHETFLDIAAGAWDFRIGRQHIIWGEMVGFFFADVVSSLDLREFVLPEFDLIRVPQWATRAEFFKGDFHADFIWIPFMTVNDIGEPGAEFFPFPIPPPSGFRVGFADEDRPDDDLLDSALGLRASYLKAGWDTSVFYYTSEDREAAFQRRIVPGPVPTAVFQPIHERIHQFGATVGKDLGPAVLQAEAVYTLDRLFEVTQLSEPDGLVEGDELRYIVGLDYVRGQHNLNVQFFQNWFPDHDNGMVEDSIESGFTVFATTDAVHEDISPEVLWFFGLNRQDWALQARVGWDFATNWRMAVGADIFGGPEDGPFGQFDDTDRVYYEFRYSF